MSKHLKLFKTTNERNAYKYTYDNTPAVSYTEQDKIVEFVEKLSRETIAGDIAYMKDGKVAFASVEEWNDNLGTPIGVVVIPSSHDDEGYSTIISLHNMSCQNPEDGTLTGNYVSDDNYMTWGNNNTFVPGLMSTNKVPIVDPYTGTSTGTSDWGDFASDMWQDPNIQSESGQYPLPCGDNVAAWPGAWIEESKEPAIASPYNQDGTKNLNYAMPGTIMEEQNGKENSSKILQVTTNGLTGVVNANSYNTGNYPANTVCVRYRTEGTESGDWYLPTIYELGYLSARFMKINESLKKLGADKAVQIGDYITANTYGYWIWSSCQRDYKVNAWAFYSNFQRCGSDVKYDYFNGFRVRAFSKIK